MYGVSSVSAYIRVAAGLCVLTLVTDVLATIMTGLGLRSNDHRTKYKYYRIAVYIMLTSCKSVFRRLWYLLILGSFSNNM